MASDFTRDYSLKPDLPPRQVVQVVGLLRADLQDFLQSYPEEGAKRFPEVALCFTEALSARLLRVETLPAQWDLPYLQTPDQAALIQLSHVYYQQLLADLHVALSKASDTAACQVPSPNLRYIADALQAIRNYIGNPVFPCYPNVDVKALEAAQSRCAHLIATCDPATGQAAVRDALDERGGLYTRLVQGSLEIAQQLNLTSFDLNLAAFNNFAGPIYKRYGRDRPELLRLLANYSITFKLLPWMQQRKDINFYFGADFVGWLIDLENNGERYLSLS